MDQIQLPCPFYLGYYGSLGTLSGLVPKLTTGSILGQNVILFFCPDNNNNL